jgi:hypothetical protein
MDFTFTSIDNDGYETEEALPAKHEVCDRCDGHGTHLHTDIGSHAYTMEEFREEYDDEERAEYFRRGGRYDVTCETCQGRRVMVVIDEAACNTPELKAALARYWALERERAECEAIHRAERRMGA